MGYKVLTVAIFLCLMKRAHVRGEYCEPPEIGRNVTISKPVDSKFPDGSRVTFECKSGYEPVDSEAPKFVTCLDTKWSTLQLKCEDVSCPAPNIPNGKRINGRAPPYGLNNFIQYKCNDGYYMIGQDQITCRANGWSSEPPQCIGYCGTPVFEGHVTISKASEVTQKYHEGTSVIFECKSGFKQEDLNASITTTCKDKGWTPLELTCKGEYCEPPEIGRNVTISNPIDSMNKFPDGSRVTFECKSGYEPVDSEAPKFVTCLDTKWSTLQLRCEGYCGNPVFE